MAEEMVENLDHQGTVLPLTVSLNSFIADWNSYKYNMTINALRIFRGETDIFI